MTKYEFIRYLAEVLKFRSEPCLFVIPTYRNVHSLVNYDYGFPSEIKFTFAEMEGIFSPICREVVMISFMHGVAWVSYTFYDPICFSELKKMDDHFEIIIDTPKGVQTVNIPFTGKGER